MLIALIKSFKTGKSTINRLILALPCSLNGSVNSQTNSLESLTILLMVDESLIDGMNRYLVPLFITRKYSI
jgi:hypothetical protein